MHHAVGDAWSQGVFWRGHLLLMMLRLVGLLLLGSLLLSNTATMLPGSANSCLVPLEMHYEPSGARPCLGHLSMIQLPQDRPRPSKAHLCRESHASVPSRWITASSRKRGSLSAGECAGSAAGCVASGALPVHWAGRPCGRRARCWPPPGDGAGNERIGAFAGIVVLGAAQKAVAVGVHFEHAEALLERQVAVLARRWLPLHSGLNVAGNRTAPGILIHGPPPPPVSLSLVAAGVASAPSATTTAAATVVTATSAGVTATTAAVARPGPKLLLPHESPKTGVSTNDPT